MFYVWWVELCIMVFREMWVIFCEIYNVQTDKQLIGEFKLELNNYSGLLGKHCVDTAKHVRGIVIKNMQGMNRPSAVALEIEE